MFEMVFGQIRKSCRADHHPARIAKADKYFAKKLDLKDIKFPLKVRDIHKIEIKNSINIGIFGYNDK